MLWKIYFYFIAFIVLFSAYYQLAVTSDFKILNLINLAANLVILLAGYCYVFKKKILETKNWKLIFKILMVLIVGNLIYQVWPSNYVGNFSLLNGALLTNIFAYLVAISLFIPLYYATYQLTLITKSSGSRPSGGKKKK